MLVVLKIFAIVMVVLFMLLTIENICEGRQVYENVFNLVIYIIILVALVIGGIVV